MLGCLESTLVGVHNQGNWEPLTSKGNGTWMGDVPINTRSDAVLALRSPGGLGGGRRRQAAVVSW